MDAASELRARDIMRTDVPTVDPHMPLTALDKAFLDHNAGGFPVVDGGRLVAVVSRSDVVRQLAVEQSLAEMVTDYWHHGTAESPGNVSLKAIGDQLGERWESLRVRDIMSRTLFTVPPDASLQQVAQVLTEHNIHRLPVVESGRFLGIITTMEFVELFASGRATVAAVT